MRFRRPVASPRTPTCGVWCCSADCRARRQLSYKQAELDLLDLVLDGNQSQNPFLFDGDTIRISEAEEIPEEAVELAAVNLSPQVISVNVIGEVEKPGRVELQANTPLVQAVLAAGGPKNWRASTGNVELVRINRNGSATLKRFKMDLGAAASNENNPPLQDGDSVKVNRSQLARASDAINTVSQPLGGSGADLDPVPPDQHQLIPLPPCCQ